MERRPELTIIAGPNGAGKSRLCPYYVSKASFDGDKLMPIIYWKYKTIVMTDNRKSNGTINK